MLRGQPVPPRRQPTDVPYVKIIDVLNALGNAGWRMAHYAISGGGGNSSGCVPVIYSAVFEKQTVVGQ